MATADDADSGYSEPTATGITKPNQPPGHGRLTYHLPTQSLLQYWDIFVIIDCTIEDEMPMPIPKTVLVLTAFVAVLNCNNDLPSGDASLLPVETFLDVL